MAVLHWKQGLLCDKKKISNSVRRNDNVLAKARKLSILPTLFDIFMYGNSIYVFSIYNLTKVFLCPFCFQLAVTYLNNYACSWNSTISQISLRNPSSKTFSRSSKSQFSDFVVSVVVT